MAEDGRATDELRRHKRLTDHSSKKLVDCVRNVVAHGDAREGKWRGNWRLEWVASTLTRPRNVVYPALLTLMLTTRLPAVDWPDSPADLNGLVHLGERWNVVSARVPSSSARALHKTMAVKEYWCCHNICFKVLVSWFYFRANRRGKRGFELDRGYSKG